MCSNGTCVCPEGTPSGADEETCTCPSTLPVLDRATNSCKACSYQSCPDSMEEDGIDEFGCLKCKDKALCGANVSGLTDAERSNLCWANAENSTLVCPGYLDEIAVCGGSCTLTYAMKGNGCLDCVFKYTQKASTCNVCQTSSRDNYGCETCQTDASKEGKECTRTDGSSGICSEGDCVEKVDFETNCEEAGGTIMTQPAGKFCTKQQQLTWTAANTWCESNGMVMPTLKQTVSSSNWKSSWKPETSCVNDFGDFSSGDYYWTSTTCSGTSWTTEPLVQVTGSIIDYSPKDYSRYPLCIMSSVSN